MAERRNDQGEEGHRRRNGVQNEAVGGLVEREVDVLVVGDIEGVGDVV
jgi:hypothetical protein